jgi:hypothetical protein
METTCTRRSWMGIASALISGLIPGLIPVKAWGFYDGEAGWNPPLADTYPSQAPELARELVTVAHFDLKRVRELVEAQASLARAAWDWGFGDWEDALGAASHTGNRAIAEYLISKGARPTLFSAAMLGQIDVVKGHVAALPGVEKIRGPHGITLLAHAKAGGAQASAVFDYLQALGDAGKDAEVPLADEERAKLLGTYSFGVSVNQRIDVTLEGNGTPQTKVLTWTRRGKVGRPIYNLGNGEFYPAGAPGARIRFAEEGGGMVMSVADPGVVLTAKRI